MSPLKCDQVLRLLSEHRDEIRRFGVHSLAVFGSVARDEAGLDSDVDLLVEFEGPATFDRFVELTFLLERLLGRPVDLVTRRSLAPYLEGRVNEEASYVPGLAPLPA